MAGYTGELKGVEYLFSQTDSALPSGIQLDKDIDEGLLKLPPPLKLLPPPLEQFRLPPPLKLPPLLE